MSKIGEAFQCLSIPIELNKQVVCDENGRQVLDANGNPEYRCGFKIGGGIDQDPKLSPQQYPDHGVYVTFIHEDGPAAQSGLKIHDKILQVNGYDFTMVTHEKAVEYLRRGKVLKMLVDRSSGFTLC